ncbi:MAG: glycosyltransferase family 4 protein [Halioglobus sp.]
MTDSNATKELKVAMACPGVGLVQRGFERMFHDIFHLVKDDLDVTLFKGGGASSKNERTLLFLTRNGNFLKWFPIHKLIGRTAFHIECLTFAISLLFAIRGQDYRIIYCTDPPLTRILYKLRKLLNLDFRLIYSEGCAMRPSDYPPADHMQQMSQVTHDEAIDYGIPAEYMTMIPLGFYPENFSVSASKSELRRKYSIAEDTFVVLCLAAINRYHKRIDYLIDEFSNVEGDVLLWIDGSLDNGDPDLVEYAQETLGERCRVTHLPSQQVGELFAVSDLMVHTACFEAFGLALIEGASTGLPVLTHNAAHFQWLMNNDPAALDMGEKGELANAVNALSKDPKKLTKLRNAEQIREKYSWVNLKAEYLKIFSKTAKLPESEIGVASKYGLN